tara:strand:- start:2868 stop:3578 length:711 start_codon:yes stop_codon:yes gene_type:complete
MLSKIKNIIEIELLNKVFDYLETSTKLDWEDGVKTTRGYLKELKKNNQLNLNLESNAEVVKLVKPIISSLINSKKLRNRFIFNIPIDIKHINIVRYKKGDIYPYHCDSIGNSLKAEDYVNIVFTIPINDNYEGGEFSVIDFTNDSKTSSEKVKQGDILIVRPWTLHQVSKITKGTRYAIIARGLIPCPEDKMPLFGLIYHASKSIEKIKDRDLRIKLKNYINGIYTFATKEYANKL